MNGIYDLGGMEGFGAIPPKDDQRPFHNKWEPLTYIVALLAAEKGVWTFDSGRHAIERIPARDYVNLSYYERVLAGMCTLAVEHGFVTKEDLERRAGGRVHVGAPIGGGQVADREHTGFDVGARVVVTRTNPTGHTRAPRYILGKHGVVLRVAPKALFPGDAAHHLPAHEEPTYHVRFLAKDLWPDAEAGASVVVDVFQSYLSAAAD